MAYPKYRDDPIFPARSFDVSRRLYLNNETKPKFLACIDNTEICDPSRKTCQQLEVNAPERVFDTAHGRATNTAHELTVTQDELARIILLAALRGSNVFVSKDSGHPWTASLEADAQCTYFVCKDLPVDQWKTEARRWFETSLALIQVNLLDIVRGTGNGHGHGLIPVPPYLNRESRDIPQIYKGICGLGKFKSVGWRNVSVSGYLGTLLVALLVLLGSCRYQDGRIRLSEGGSNF